MASPVMRWPRLLWPELIFGAVWIQLFVLTHTVFTDDDVWQHTAIDGLQWVVFAGYVLAAATAHRRLYGAPSTGQTDRD
ncbi:MAG: hypothetical protein JO265_06025 [Acidimicrobiia bacterium]|nr:hypothetical protein [Acidimicrobiia bacterium]